MNKPNSIKYAGTIADVINETVIKRRYETVRNKKGTIIQMIENRSMAECKALIAKVKGDCRERLVKHMGQAAAGYVVMECAINQVPMKTSELDMETPHGVATNIQVFNNKEVIITIKVNYDNEDIMVKTSISLDSSNLSYEIDDSEKMVPCIDSVAESDKTGVCWNVTEDETIIEGLHERLNKLEQFTAEELKNARDGIVCHISAVADYLELYGALSSAFNPEAANTWIDVKELDEGHNND